eukprot:1396125-Prymnesium_polylepis.1
MSHRSCTVSRGPSAGRGEPRAHGLAPTPCATFEHTFPARGDGASPLHVRDVHGEQDGDRFSPVWCVKRMLRRISEEMERLGKVAARSNRALGGRDCCAWTADECLEHLSPSTAAPRA